MCVRVCHICVGNVCNVVRVNVCCVMCVVCVCLCVCVCVFDACAHVLPSQCEPNALVLVVLVKPDLCVLNNGSDF